MLSVVSPFPTEGMPWSVSQGQWSVEWYTADLRDKTFLYGQWTRSFRNLLRALKT